MTKKTLLFVVNDAKYFTSHRLPIAKKVSTKGFEVHLSAPSNEAQEALFRKEGITFHASPLKRGKSSLKSEVKYIIHLYQLYKEYNFDVIHHVTIKPVLFGGIAARLAKVKSVVCAISGMGYIFINQGIKASIVRKLVIVGYRFAFKQQRLCAIFQNEDDRSIFLENHIVNKRDTVLIKGSGVDLKLFSAATLPPTDNIYVTLPARMLWDKGVGEFVKAARLVKQETSHIIFQLAGGIDTENPAGIPEEQLKAWQEEGVVSWLGHRTDMADIFTQSHIVCLPSYREGLPKALIEAMGCARTIVTTDVPGCREVIEHGVNGHLVPVKNASKLAESILLLAKNPKMLDEMGRNSRKKAENEFSVDMVIEKTLDVYKRLEQ